MYVGQQIIHSIEKATADLLKHQQTEGNQRPDQSRSGVCRPFPAASWQDIMDRDTICRKRVRRNGTNQWNRAHRGR